MSSCRAGGYCPVAKTAAVLEEDAYDRTSTGRALASNSQPNVRLYLPVCKCFCLPAVQLDEVNMQNSAAKLFLTVIAFTLFTDESSAMHLRSDGSVEQEVQIEQQQVVPSSM
jgi:hypothetical protein